LTKQQESQCSLPREPDEVD